MALTAAQKALVAAYAVTVKAQKQTLKSINQRVKAFETAADAAKAPIFFWPQDASATSKLSWEPSAPGSENYRLRLIAPGYSGPYVLSTVTERLSNIDNLEAMELIVAQL